MNGPRAFAVVVCATSLVAACSEADDSDAGNDTVPTPPDSASTSASTSTTTVPPTSAPALSPPPVPDRAAYLGMWTRNASNAAAGEPAPGVGIAHVYTRWQSPAPTRALEAITSTGAVPLLDWACGPDDDIAAGALDDQIRDYAEALRDFGRPLFLRYAWEMNLHRGRNDECRGADGPDGFVAAWRHVRRVFRDAGATNVAFVWCPGVARPRTWGQYYPGADAVDWIGVDGYVRSADPADASSAFHRVFGDFYDEFVGEGRPFMVAETGALRGVQAGYLSSLRTVLPEDFPEVKAVVYFDAPGPRGNWSLEGAGRDAFVSLAADPYFSFRA